MSTRGDAGGKTKKMREIPVLFNGAMVRSILDDRKTQTRRIVKGACNLPHEGKLLGEWGLSKPPARWDGVKPPWRWMSKKPIRVGDWFEQAQTDVDDYVSRPVRSPLGKPGDRLWVRETWMPYDTSTEDDAVWVLYKASNDQRPDGIAPEKFGSGVRRSAPVQVVEWARDAIEMEEVVGGRWRPSIHMPRWAARLFLGVQDVRIERLQDISEEDARAEGVDEFPIHIQDQNGRIKTAIYHRLAESCRDAFQRLWISVYGAESWAANPWVWVTEFKRVTQP